MAYVSKILLLLQGVLMLSCTATAVEPNEILAKHFVRYQIEGEPEVYLLDQDSITLIASHGYEYYHQNHIYAFKDIELSNSTVHFGIILNTHERVTSRTYEKEPIVFMQQYWPSKGIDLLYSTEYGYPMTLTISTADSVNELIQGTFKGQMLRAREEDGTFIELADRIPIGIEGTFSMPYRYRADLSEPLEELAEDRPCYWCWD